MLWRQPGWLRSVLASKFGADCSLLVSPENVKLSCCPLVLLEPRLLLELEEDDGRRSIHGTATCLPEELLELDRPELLPEEVPLGLLPLPELLLGVVELLLPPNELLDEPDELPLGVELPPDELPPVLLELSDKIAKSIRPELGFIIVSLIVPRVSPEEPVTVAPIN
jgi:hypothetical protein